MPPKSPINRSRESRGVARSGGLLVLAVGWREGSAYGRAAAAGIEGHGQWCSVREDTLMPLILDFFEQRMVEDFAV
jgi:hypothetical protein